MQFRGAVGEGISASPGASVTKEQVCRSGSPGNRFLDIHSIQMTSPIRSWAGFLSNAVTQNS